MCFFLGTYFRIFRGPLKPWSKLKFNQCSCVQSGWSVHSISTHFNFDVDGASVTGIDWFDSLGWSPLSEKQLGERALKAII